MLFIYSWYFSVFDDLRFLVLLSFFLEERIEFVIAFDELLIFLWIIKIVISFYINILRHNKIYILIERRHEVCSYFLPVLLPVLKIYSLRHVYYKFSILAVVLGGNWSIPSVWVGKSKPLNKCMMSPINNLRTFLLTAYRQHVLILKRLVVFLLINFCCVQLRNFLIIF